MTRFAGLVSETGEGRGQILPFAHATFSINRRKHGMCQTRTASCGGGPVLLQLLRRRCSRTACFSELLARPKSLPEASLPVLDAADGPEPTIGDLFRDAGPLRA